MVGPGERALRGKQMAEREPTITDITAEKNQLSQLHVRMDADEELYNLQDYVMKTSTGTAVPNVINVTLNYPATFAAHIASALMAATMQANVTGKGLKDEDTHPIEEFLGMAFLDADTLLREQDEDPLRPFLVEQLNIRGRGAARVTCRVEDGVLVPDILPVDTRHLYFQRDRKGFAWVAYETWRSPARIRSEYPGASGVGGSRDISVIDFWSRNVNRVYINRSLQHTVGNEYGYPPFCFERVPLGSMLKSSGFQVRRGESIFFLIRKLLPELNRLVSIMQTLNMNTVKGAKQYASKIGPQAEPPEAADVDEFGSVLSVDIGGGISLIPTGDINAAGRLALSLLQQMIQVGSMSLTDYGNLTDFPLAAVALVELGESKGQVFLPRLGAKGLLYQQIARMLVDQTLQAGVTGVELGTPGHRTLFKTDILKKAYDIQYRFTVKSPQLDMARFSMAELARTIFDEDTVLRDVMQVENPSEVRRKKRFDEAERISPGIKQFRTARALIKEGEEVEAEIMANELGYTLEQVASGKLGEPPDTGNGRHGTPRSIPPTRGTRAGSNKQASLMSGEPEEGV